MEEEQGKGRRGWRRRGTRKRKSSARAPGRKLQRPAPTGAGREDAEAKEQQSQTFMAEPTQKPFSVLFAKLHALPRKEQLFTHLLFLILKRASRMEDRGCVEPPCPRATRSER